MNKFIEVSKQVLNTSTLINSAKKIALCLKAEATHRQFKNLAFIHSNMLTQHSLDRYSLTDWFQVGIVSTISTLTGPGKFEKSENLEKNLVWASFYLLFIIAITHYLWTDWIHTDGENQDFLLYQLTYFCALMWSRMKDLLPLARQRSSYRVAYALCMYTTEALLETPIDQSLISVSTLPNPRAPIPQGSFSNNYTCIIRLKDTWKRSM